MSEDLAQSLTEEEEKLVAGTSNQTQAASTPGIVFFLENYEYRDGEQILNSLHTTLQCLNVFIRLVWKLYHENLFFSIFKKYILIIIIILGRSYRNHDFSHFAKINDILFIPIRVRPSFFVRIKESENEIWQSILIVLLKRMIIIWE